jgi:FAD/FMN-containing dehydrogenase
MGNSTARHDIPEAPAPPPLPGTPEDLASLQLQVKNLHFPGTPEYNAARVGRTWQLDPEAFMKPSAIACVASPEEVLACVRFAMATGVKLQAACGRHTHVGTYIYICAFNFFH